MTIDIDLAWLIALALSGVAAAFDLRYRIIPNTIFVVAILSALVLIALGLLDWRASALGFAAMGGVAICVYLLGGFGGGDVKLLAGVGALVGIGSAWEIMIVAYAVAVLIFLFATAFNLVVGPPQRDGAAAEAGLIAAAPKSIAFAPAIFAACAAAPWDVLGGVLGRLGAAP